MADETGPGRRADGEAGQAAAVAFLADPATHGLSGPVEVLTTHISHLFLAGPRVFKLKRAVRLAYADFSTPALRLAACEREVSLNRATAPALYRGVRRITRAAGGGLSLDGEGETVDAVVEMARFDQDRLLDRMAAEGRLTAPMMTALAREIARFHRGLEPAGGVGGADAIAGVLDVNEEALATAALFPAQEVAALNAAFRDGLARHRAALDRRAAEGRVRRCHGDLHLRNIYLDGDVPTPFDCIEFSEALATIDVLYDLAFVLMDLWHRGLSSLASIVANRYCDEAGEEEGFALLPYFLALRAAVRAHVEASRAADGPQASEAGAEARAYFGLAGKLLRPAPARLFAIGGLSGSGKSTVAAALAPQAAPAPGARILESDRIRKAMFGVPAEARLGEQAYRPEISQAVYGRLVDAARRILAAGGTVVANAVFDRCEDRHAVAAAAAAAGVPFTGIWLHADPDLLRVRVRARRGGASDATVAVLEGQLARAADDPGWARVDATAAPGEVAAAILARAGPPGA